MSPPSNGGPASSAAFQRQRLALAEELRGELNRVFGERDWSLVAEEVDAMGNDAVVEIHRREFGLVDASSEVVLRVVPNVERPADAQLAEALARLRPFVSRRRASLASAFAQPCLRPGWCAPE